MNSVLLLDLSGQPRRWISVPDAISYNIAGAVVWSLGDTTVTYRGGWQRDGRRSTATTASIIAIRGRPGRARPQAVLSNRSLFGRDRNICAYCGGHFPHPGDLSRDHIVPRSRGGPNTWTNVVTACRGCNSHKGDRLLEEAGMELLYLPYTPCHRENMILQNRNILGDQMEYLLQDVPRTSRMWTLPLKSAQNSSFLTVDDK